MPRLVLLLVAIAAASNPPADAQTDALRFRQPVGDGYEVRIRTAYDADCGDGAESLFAAVGEGSTFEAVGATAAPCEPAETLSLWHRGAPVDSVGGFRLWLGAPIDTLIWEDLEPEDHPVPDGAVRDLTGDGVPDLVVGTYSGGAHCCYGYLVVALGDEPFLLDHINSGDSGVGIDEVDGAPILRLADVTFAYWNTSFAGSPAPEVVLAWHGERFAPSVRHMTKPPLPEAELAARVAETRDAAAWRERSFPPVSYWATLLDLLYAGRGEQAARFAREAWAADALGRAVFLQWFRDQLWQSPYAPEVTEMNEAAVDWL